MNLLLDTHAFIWFMEGSERLSQTARNEIEGTEGRLLLSAASGWEMAIKTSLGKLDLGALTAFLYAFNLREAIYNVMESASGQRFHPSYSRVGGLMNDVSPETGVMGGDRNSVHLVTHNGVESWPPQSKDEVARALIGRIAATLKGNA